VFCDVYKYSVVVNTMCWNFEFHKKASSLLTGNVHRRLKDSAPWIWFSLLVGWLVGCLVSFVGCSCLVCLLVS